MPDNLIRIKQLYKPEISGLVQDVISSNEYQLTYQGGTGININNVAIISISGVQLNLTDSPIISSLTVSGNLIAPNLVYNTGNQNISGVKTFTTGIIAPNLVYNTGEQTISGFKTFANGINIDGINTLSFSGVNIEITSGYVTSTNAISAPNLVYNQGDQIISGVKTFVNNLIISSGVLITGDKYFWFNTGTGGNATSSPNTLASFYLESGIAYRLESHLTFAAGTNVNTISDLSKSPAGFADAIGFRQGSNNSSDLRDATLTGYLQLGYSNVNGSIWGSVSGRANHIRRGIIRPTGGNGTITFTWGSWNGSNARLTENYILLEKIARI